jgi:thioesterase domain-containing protein
VRNRLWIAGHRHFVRTGRALHPWFREIGRVNRWAMKNHVTPATDCRVAIFHAGPPQQWTKWKRLARGGVDTIAILSPGVDHDSIMQEPHAEVLAREVTAAVERLAPAQERAA